MVVVLLLLPCSAIAWQWSDLWQTANQQATKLLQAGKAQEAAHVFKNKDWQTVALYRSGNYSQAFKQFASKNTSDNQYNAGNAAAYQGHYQEAIKAYDQAITLNPKNADAVTNRDIIKKLMDKKQQAKKDDKDNKNESKDKKDNNSQQDMGQNKSPKKNNADKQSAQNAPQQDAAKQQTSASKPQQPQNTPDQKQNNQQANSKPPKEDPASANRVHAQNEDKKQLLRRLAEDPGGLLRQKFMRDYFRRHGSNEEPNQGEN